MKLYILATLLLAAIVAADEKKSYTGYKLVRVTVPNKEQMDYITNLENTDPGFDIWNIGKIDGEIVATIMLSPRAYYQYKKVFAKRNLSFELINDNVQEMFDYQEQSMELTRLRGAARNDIINKFARYTEIYNFVLDTAEKYPTITKTYNAGQSTEGRNLPVLVINTTGTKKNIIWIDCGIHAREWVTHPTCIYIIDQLVNAQANNDAETIALLDRFEFHILPLYNPDGYEYSQASDRMWRKNRKKHTALCTGTDLNRNADYFWNTAGTGALCIQDNYAGPSVASEVETQAVTKAVSALKDDLLAYYTIHSYGNWWLLPYGHDTSLDAPNLAELKENGNRAAAAIKALYGEKFTVGKSSELLYLTTGTTSDWAYYNLNIPISVTVELRPGAESPDSSYGFKLPEDRLPEVTKETWAGLKASIQHVAENH